MSVVEDGGVRPPLSVTGLGLRVGRGESARWLFRRMSFEVRRGEALAVIGPPGAGKSTLIKIVAGGLSPSEGRVEGVGRLASLVAPRIFFPSDRTLRQAVFDLARFRGVGTVEAAKRLPEIIADAWLSRSPDTRIGKLSRLELVQLSAVAAIAFAPAVVIADDTLVVGDKRFRPHFIEILKRRLADGAALLFVGRSDRLVREFVRNVLVLDGDKTRVAPFSFDDSIFDFYEADGGEVADPSDGVDGGNEEDPDEDGAEGEEAAGDILKEGEKERRRSEATEEGEELARIRAATRVAKVALRERKAELAEITRALAEARADLDKRARGAVFEIEKAERRQPAAPRVEPARSRLSVHFVGETFEPIAQAPMSDAGFLLMNASSGGGSFRLAATFFYGRRAAFTAFSPEIDGGIQAQMVSLKLPNALMWPGKWRAMVELLPLDDLPRMSATVNITIAADPPNAPRLTDWTGRMPSGVLLPSTWGITSRAAGDEPKAAAEGNENGALLNMSVSRNDGDGALVEGDGVTITLDFDLNVEGLPARCVIDGQRDADTPLFRLLMPFPKPLPAGAYRAKCRLDDGYLPAGNTSMTAILVFPDPAGPAPLIWRCAAELDVLPEQSTLDLLKDLDVESDIVREALRLHLAWHSVVSFAGQGEFERRRLDT